MNYQQRLEQNRKNWFYMHCGHAEAFKTAATLFWNVQFFYVSLFRKAIYTVSKLYIIRTYMDKTDNLTITLICAC